MSTTEVPCARFVRVFSLAAPAFLSPRLAHRLPLQWLYCPTDRVRAGYPLALTFAVSAPGSGQTATFGAHIGCT